MTIRNIFLRENKKMAYVCFNVWWLTWTGTANEQDRMRKSLPEVIKQDVSSRTYSRSPLPSVSHELMFRA
jgi:hypothetical protein